MAINTALVDGTGSGNQAHVDDEKNLGVSVAGLPPKNPEGTTRIFREYFSTSAGVTDMRVDGSVTPVDFYIEPTAIGDRYVDSINFVISDAGADLNEFGAITALTNGVEIFYEDQSLGNVAIHEGIQTNFDMIRLCQGNPAFGSGNTAFLASNVVGLSEAYIGTLDFSTVFGLPWGLRLPQGSPLRLVVRIKDNITAIDKFDIIAYGYDRL